MERDTQLTFRVFETMVILMAVVFVYLGTYSKTFGDTALSRLATVYALTEYGTWYIDRPIDEEPIRFEQRTIDKVQVGDRLISSKPPVLPLIMTGEYLLMNSLFGWHLDSPEDTEKVVQLLSLTLIGLAYVVLLIFFLKTARLFIDDGMARFFSLFALAFGTQLWGYGTNINNHMPGACLLMIAVYLALGLGSGKLEPKAWRFFAFGFFGALMPTVDMPGGIFVFIAGLYLLATHPRMTLQWVVAGMVLPLAVHFYVMISVTGSPLPVQVRNDLYLYEASYWRNPRGIDALNEPKWNYLLHMTFGRTGMFLLYPVTALGLMGIVHSLVNPRFTHRGFVLAGAAGFLLLTAYYALRTNNYGGEAFGFRWYIVAMPILMLMALPYLARLKEGWKWAIVGLLMGVSFYSAWQCTVEPWRSNVEWTVEYLGRSYEW